MTTFVHLNFAGHQARQKWRAATNKMFQVEEVEIGDPADFQGQITHARLGELLLSDVRSSREWARRNVSTAEEDDVASAVLVHVLEGHVTLKWRRGECLLGPNSLVLYKTTKPYDWQHARYAKVRNVAIPYNLLKTRLRDPERLMSQPIDGSNSLWPLATGIVNTIFTQLTAIPNDAEQNIVSQLVDCIALSLTHSGHSIFDHPSAREAIFLRCKSVALNRLWDQNLTPQSLADRAGVSLRSLHRIFYERGITVSEFIAQARMDAACSDLLDPKNRQTSMAEIALRNGFRSASYFATSFKSRFLMTPSECRASGIDPRKNNEPH